MRVLITGGGGFIGSHLVDSQLAQGHQVRTIDLQVDRLAHVKNHPCLEIIEKSLTDATLSLTQLVQDINIVYHLASAHLDVTLSDAAYELVNVTVTEQLLHAAAAAGVRRFVHCSTNSVVGQIDQPPIDETAACYPTNIYEITKLAGEQVVLAYQQKTGYEVVVIRPSWVYGPRCPRTAKLFRTIRKGRFLMFGGGQTLRHPIYVSDAVKGFELAAERDNVVGQIYFIAGETAVTISELTQLIAEVQGAAKPRLHFPLWMGQLAGYLAEKTFTLIGRQPPVSRRSLDFYTKDNAYDISKAHRELGFNPQIDLRTGLQQTLAALSPGIDKTNDK